jgi:hypothetical protein
MGAPLWREDGSVIRRQIPVFISPKNTVVQLYPRALPSPFVTSYDSQGYGEGILPDSTRFPSRLVGSWRTR